MGLNPIVSPIEVLEDDELNLTVVAEFVEVLGVVLYDDSGNSGA